MDTLAQFKQALSDRYAIEREIGAGGMATVYLARDLRHDRPVALKLLNPELGAVLGVERFLAEIKVTANLQHPNLLPLFDSGEAGGQLFYVMPFVAGESLRARLEREKQLPIEDAIRIAVAAANALDYAHGHGVIHRDLKPENILIQAGQPVVADFGIALAVSKAGGNRITQTGLSLGTPQYMSPEQATGDRVIDGRSDIYSLAAVTYEMLTGEPPHIGNTAQAVIARVLTDKPRPVRQSRSAVPESVDAAVAQALEKLPADRFATAREYAEALQGRGHAVTRATAARPAATGQTRRSYPVALGAAAGVLVAALGLMALVLTRPAPTDPVPVIRFRFTGTDSAPPLAMFPWPAAISPDGSTLVYWASTAGSSSLGGGRELTLRRLDQLGVRPIPGTEGGSQPVFSPDGEWVAFEAGNKERKVKLDGSAPVTIADGGGNNGAAWTTGGELILGSTGSRRGLSRVSVAGGEPAELTRPDTANGETDHLWPIAHPDGRIIAFVIWSGSLGSSRLAITSVEDGKVTPLGIKGIRPLAILDESLVYVQADGTVMGVPIKARGRKLDGTPVPVHDPVPVASTNNGNSDVYLSTGGALLSSTGARGSSRLAILARDGTGRPIAAAARGYVSPRFSPDARRIAVLIRDADQQDVWIHEISTGTLTRLTSVQTVTSFHWTTDGKHIVFTAPGPKRRGGFWKVPVEVAAPPELLWEVDFLAPGASLAPDGRSLLMWAMGEGGWSLLQATPGSSEPVRPWAVGPGDDFEPRFSPDGKWVALSNDESGALEVYVRSFPEPTAKVQVSVGGGRVSSWSADGKTLYYTRGNVMMAAKLEVGASIRVLSRDTAFRTGSNLGERLNASVTESADVTGDGSRMLYLDRVSSRFELIVVPNWIKEFRTKMASSRR